MDATLARRLGTRDAVVIGLGSMIGAGVFSAFAPAAAAAGSGLLVGLALAAGVAYCNAVASAQLAARCLELALHLRSHLFHALDGFRKPFICVAEEGFSVGGGLFIKGTHRPSRTLPLFLGIFAHAFILFADRAGALGARF